MIGEGEIESFKIVSFKRERERERERDGEGGPKRTLNRPGSQNGYKHMQDFDLFSKNLRFIIYCYLNNT